jgi:hypothetical protein
MLILDTAGGILPEGFNFLKPGWWLVHILASGLVFAWGYRRGRLAERRARKASEPPKDVAKDRAAE